MSTFVFVESNTTGTGELLVRKAIERGHSAVLLSSNIARYSFVPMDGLVAVAVDTLDVEAVCELVGALSEVVAVFSSSEYFIETASEVASRLGLHTANTAAIRTCRDKQALAECLGAHGIPRPDAVHVSLPDLQDETVRRLHFPAVVKPRRGSGSVQVRRVDDLGECLAHFEAMAREGNLEALVQPYIAGAEYSVETITANGRTQLLGIVRKYLGPEPDFVEIGHSFPARLGSEERAVIENTVVRALAAVGFAFGPAHIELRLARGVATIIEINPRLAGGLIPVMLDDVFDSDLLGDIVDLWTGVGEVPDPMPRRFGAIRFALSPRAGHLRAPVRLPDDAPGRELLRHFHAIRQPGEALTLGGDFRDRVAAVICAGPCQETVEATARALCARIAIDVDERPHSDAVSSTPVLPEALQVIVYGGGAAAAHASPASELALLADVNEAHLVMLAETGLVDRAHADALLRAHHSLRDAGFAPLLALPRPRGTYIMLEQYLIAQLGPEAGGVLQTGRSRNDINAAVTKLKLRAASADLQRRLARLRAALILQASRHVGEAFPVYSQFQPAQPGTLAHQLLAIDAALAAETVVLLDAIPELDVCPLGAAAGAGTTFAIDPELVARLLGFERASRNSLDAVASRGAALHFLSSLNALGVLLSRVAQDLQQWTTMESALVRMPDALCGASSMMPQKRNPFLVELVKARACVPVGCLATATAVMSKVPYANSYEAGSPVDALVAQATGAIVDGLTVLQALVEGMTVDASRVDARLRESAVAASAVAETLVRDRHLSFRTAHGLVGQALRPNGGDAPSARALLELSPFLAEHAPLEWALQHAHGGGPGSARLGDGIAHACNGLAADEARLRAAVQLWQEGASLRRLAIERALEIVPAAVPQPEPESAR